MADYSKLQESSLDDADSFQSWRKKEPKSYKEIVLKQIELCRIEESKQMVGNTSFYQRDESGSFVQIHIFDQRKIFIQCVLTFHDLMLRYFDKEIKDNITLINETIKKQQEANIKYYISVEPRKDYKELAINTNTISNTQIGGKLISDFENFKYNQHRKIFQELLLLFDRKNELSTKRTVSTY